MRTEGWGWLLNAKKAHYFKGGRSLCRRWFSLDEPIWEKIQERGAAPDKGTCGPCWKKAPETAPVETTS